MLELITGFFIGLNNIGVGNGKDPLRRFYCCHCCDTCNTNACLSLHDDKLYAQPGCGPLPAEFTFQPRPGHVAQALAALAQLADSPREKVYARYVKPVAAEHADYLGSASSGQNPPPPYAEHRASSDHASSHTDHSDNHSYLTRTLQGIDQAVNSAVNAILPWRQAQAQEIASNITVPPLTDLNNATDFSVADADNTTTDEPDEEEDCNSWCIHYRNDSQTLFAQQMKIFLAATETELGDERQQALTALLAGRDILFFYPQASNSSRSRRRLESEAQREWLAFELEMHDKTVDKNSTGWKILTWSDKQTQRGFAMFNIGLETKDPRWFAAGGGEILLGYFSGLVGGVWSGTLFDRQPGETRQEQFMRLGMGMAQLPEAKANKVFNYQPKPVPGRGGWRPRGAQDWPPGPGHPARPVLRLGDAEGISTPQVVKAPSGTLLTHRQSGITLQSILQTDIAGQRWHLFPQAPYAGTAVPVGVTPAISHTAVRNPDTLQWRIDGVAGEHAFIYSTQPNFYLKSTEQYHPVTVSAEEGTLRLLDGQKLYFHQPSQQWKPFYAGNSHLHARCLSVIPEESVSVAPGQHQVLISVSGAEKRVWSLTDGSQYLEVRSQASNPNSETIGYVKGRLEADFFSLQGEPFTPPWRQSVLQWRTTTQKWDVATSPFKLLGAVESEIHPSWVYIHPDASELAAVYHSPGLYRHGNDYFLRWQSDATGTARYLPLAAGELATEYAIDAPGSEHIRLAYDAQQMMWRARTLSLEAFAELPESARMELSPPLTAEELVSGYEHLYRRGREYYLHTGNGKYGTPEYIRVEQDAQNADVLRLRVAGEGGAETHWLFRYDDDEEFVLDEKQLCQQRKRADEEPCASTSTAESPLPVRPIKKPRVRKEMSSSELAWLNQNPRQEGEMLLPGESHYLRRQKSLYYASRLSLLAPKEMPLKYIADWAGVDVLSVRAWMTKTDEQAKAWLELHAQMAGESGIDYALRLCRMQQPGVSITDISRHTGLRENSIQIWLKMYPTDGSEWLSQFPQEEGESNLDYAYRLARQPDSVVSVGVIARHAGADEIILRQRLKGLTPLQVSWLARHPRYPGEQKFEYGVRLSLLPNKTGLSYNAIAGHAGVNPGSMRSRIYRTTPGTRQWLNGVPQLENETPLDYAQRLYELSAERRRAGQIKFSEIAIYAGVSHTRLLAQIRHHKALWFNRTPRQGKEVIEDFQDEFIIQRKNQLYAKRLITLRDQQRMSWLVTNDDIVFQSAVTEETLAKLLDPTLTAVQQEAILPLDMESGWQPVEGLLHLDVKENPPLLVDASNVQRSVTHEVIKEPLWISDIKQIEKTLQMSVEQSWLRQAAHLVKTDGSDQKLFFDYYFDVFYDVTRPELGLHLITKRPVAKGTFLLIYTGVWHPDLASLKAECRKTGTQNVLKYLWGVKKGAATVSAFHNANKLALMNTGKVPGYPSLGENNVGIGYINDRAPFYYVLEDIAANKQPLVPYGDLFLPDYVLQTSLNNDIIKIIAQKKQRYFVVQDLDGNAAYAFGPEGVVDVAVARKQAERYTLKERKDERGIIRYDAISKSGKRLIAKSKDDGNNLYHAMAKALHPQFGHDRIEETIKEMKQEVAEVYAREDGVVKQEPADQRK